MTDTQSLLDEALRLGNLELQMLAEGELDEAEETARKRCELLSEALNLGEGSPPECAPSRELEELQDKLGQLMALQGKLTSEARQLHQEVRSELLRTRQESTRFGAYGKASKQNGRTSFLHKRS